MTENICRELTLEKEIELYQKEAKELFKTEENQSEAPFANNIVRRGMRIIRKSKVLREKQIPKKPIKYDKYYYKCPVCDTDICVSEEDLTIYEETPPYYCKKCGQALDWSD